MSKKVDRIMDDTENPEAQIPETPAARFGDRLEGRAARPGRALAMPGAGFAGRLGQFIRDVRAEMQRVSWPTLNEVKNTTVITLVAVVFFAVYLFLVDSIWAFLRTQLDHLLNWLTGTA